MADLVKLIWHDGIGCGLAPGDGDDNREEGQALMDRI